MAQSGEVTLDKVVTGRLLEVADYQRPYAWERKQLLDLWEDLDLLGNKGHHYAGTLVLKEVEADWETADDGEALTRYEVVDGQQRLTTCLLLLDRIRRAVQPVAVEGAAGVAGRLQATYGNLKVDGVTVPRLRLGAELQEVWRDHILATDPISQTVLVGGAQRLRAAADFYDERLEELVEGLAPEQTFARLKELQRRIVGGLRFLVYEVQSDAEVGVVFETLNERGKPLTELEKVKNYLLYLARQLPKGQMNDLAELINETWSHIFRELSRLPSGYEERLLRAHWITTVEPDARQWKRITSVKSRFPRSKYVPGSQRLSQPTAASQAEDLSEVLYGEVQTYVKSLKASATYVAELYSASAEYHAFDGKRAEIRSATAALRRSPVEAIFLPLVLAFRLKHPSDANAYLALIELCEKYSARVFAICQRRSNAGEPYLARIAHEVFTGAAAPAEALTRIAALIWEYAPDDEVEQNLTGKGNWYARQAHKYFLYEYERSLAKSDADVISWNDIVDTGTRKTTEHILPQNPDAESAWLKQYFTRAQHEELRHVLGNLVLTYDNSSYSNKEYVDKRGSTGQVTPKCYFTAKLRSEVEVAQQYEEWTPEAVRKRQEGIADWAMKRWHVPAPSASDAQAVEAEVEEEIEASVAEAGSDDDLASAL